MATWFRTSEATGGTFFAPSETAASTAPTVNTQPSNQSAREWDSTFTIDVGSGVTGALSYAISPAVDGFSVNDSGVVSYDGAGNGSARAVTLNVIAYELAAQSGASTALNAFTQPLIYGAPAAIEYPPSSGSYAPFPHPENAFFGRAVEQGDTWEPDNVPSGFTVTPDATDAGMFTVTNVAGNLEGTYSFDVRWAAASGAPKTGFSVSFDVFGEEIPPVFSGTIPTQSWTLGQAITALDLNNYFDPNPATYTLLSGSLPGGITIASGVISGTPTASATGSLQYRGSNAYGSDDTNTFAFSVTATAPTFSGSISSQSWQVGEAITPLDISGEFTGDELVYSASGLPSGLSINSSSGVITGTPASVSTGSFTISATNSGGTASSGGVSWAVIDAVPDAFGWDSRVGISINATNVEALTAITLTGIATDAAFTVSGGTVQINGGSWVSSGTYSPGDTIKPRLNASASFSTQTTVTVTVGGVAGTFSITTLAEPVPISARLIGDGTTLEIIWNRQISIGAGGSGGFAGDSGQTIGYSSGDGLQRWEFTASPAMVPGDSVVYTQPGNGAEDADGNDVASFTIELTAQLGTNGITTPLSRTKQTSITGGING
jgi:hypothetical protein